MNFQERETKIREREKEGSKGYKKKKPKLYPQKFVFHPPPSLLQTKDWDQYEETTDPKEGKKDLNLSCLRRCGRKIGLKVIGVIQSENVVPVLIANVFDAPFDLL
ncbi:hypothetical protein CTI12_AA065970 [Artemisia annua]|uniref:Uncharacterized protein n=1 Tax=Artemisia annua TaxID=35608 RepID=A0A2U1Q7F3_ARTAN|nr:hypothetical protein CTI12_AA065970 [Artemisia annua]